MSSSDLLLVPYTAAPRRVALHALALLLIPRELSSDCYITLSAHRVLPQADNVITRQAALDQYWSRNGLRLLANGITKDSLRAALVTVGHQRMAGTDRLLEAHRSAAAVHPNLVLVDPARNHVSTLTEV